MSVVGSVTPPGRLRRAVEEASERIRPLVGHVELIDLGEHRMSFADGREPSSFLDDTGAVVEAIERAHVVIFATPVYRGSMERSFLADRIWGQLRSWVPNSRQSFRVPMFP